MSPGAPDRDRSRAGVGATSPASGGAATASPAHERACDRCLARTWLLERLSGHIEQQRARIRELLALTEGELIEAVGGAERAAARTQWLGFDAEQAGTARRRAAAAGLTPICGCDAAYPRALRALAAPPAVLHVAGGVERFLQFCEADPVAIVGARRADRYGLEVTRALARGVAAAGVTVVSGMAAGVDAQAHRGALEARGATIAVLPGPADRPYPAANAQLYRELTRSAVVVSELGPGASVRRWMFAARNRLIAALARLTVVVQAAPGSGSLLTAEFSRALERPLGAVPGQVTSRLSAGPLQLLADGAVLIRDAQDVLDVLFGAGARRIGRDTRAPLTAEQAPLLAAIAGGVDTAAALVGAGVAGEHCLAELSRLELAGRLRRGAGGRFVVLP